MKLDIEHLTKRYRVERDEREVLALSDVSLSVADGEFMAIVGPERMRQDDAAQHRRRAAAVRNRKRVD